MTPALTLTAPAPDVLPLPTKLLTLTGVLLALFLCSLDQTIVATALPRIVADLHGFDRLTWVATAYLVASTTLVPVYGKLADMYSRRAIEVAALLVFLGGSALCGLAGEFGTLPLLGDGMSQLIIFRAVQGLGGAGLFAMAFIIIADLFSPAERGRYQGFVGATFGLASVLGPFVGGLLTDHGTGLVPGIAGWRLVFYVNLPLGMLALWFILARMPPLQPRCEKQALDYFAAVLLMLGLVPLVLALQLNKALYPWTSPTTLGLLAAAALALTLFVARSLRAANPILDLRLFRNHVFRPAVISVFLLGGSFLSIVIFEPLFMVNVIGVSATKAGVSLIPLSLGVVTGSMLAGRMVARFGYYKRWMLGGGLVLLGGLLLLATMPPTVAYAQVLAYVLLCGLGLGPTMPLYTLAVQNAIEPRFLGQATAACQFFRQIGGAVAAALLGTVLTMTLAGTLPAGTPAPLPTLLHAAGPGGAAEHGALPSQLPAPTPEVRAAFARAISRIYLCTMCLVAAGWVASLFVPELPLRRSNAGAPAR